MFLQLLLKNNVNAFIVKQLQEMHHIRQHLWLYVNVSFCIFTFLLFYASQFISEVTFDRLVSIYLLIFQTIFIY